MTEYTVCHVIVLRYNDCILQQTFNDNMMNILGGKLFIINNNYSHEF